MDRLSAMHVFVRVAELGSFSAVAQQLGVARSVVTRQVAALEQHLGSKLMERSTRRLTLTSAGAAYLEKCRVILNLVELAETGIAEQRLAAQAATDLARAQLAQAEATHEFMASEANRAIALYEKDAISQLGHDIPIQAHLKAIF